MKTSTLLLAGLAVLCAAPAIAQTTSVPVSFAGLDLTSQRGQEMLNSRILRAATMVCGTPDARDLPAVAATNKCKSNALAQAQTRVTIAIAASQPNVQIATAR